MESIEQYLFDPNSKEKCKSYKILLNNAKDNDCGYLISSKFFFYFVSELDIFKEDFSLELEFKKYDEIDKEIIKSRVEKKIDLYAQELIDKFKIFSNLYYSEVPSFGYQLTLRRYELQNWVQKLLTEIVNNRECYYNVPVDDKKYTEPFVVISNCSNFAQFKFAHLSVFITLEKLQNDFFQKRTENVYPIFLKNIEDIDILLNTLMEDLNLIPKDSNKIEKNSCSDIETLEDISIENFFSIKNIYLNLKNRKEVYIVGENGDGKTLLLQAIAVGLKGTLEDGLEEFRKIEKEYKIDISNDICCRDNFFAYGASRNSVCQLKEDKAGYLTLFSGSYDLKDPAKWLIELYNAQNAQEKTIISLNEAIQLLKELLNRDIDINVSYNSVTFKEKGAKVSFAQLSAGYRGVITIISDLISRLSKKQQVDTVANFKGVVLIDEVELHLHPKWQYGFIKKLRNIFPLIQFVVTTHSPTVILGASSEATFFKIFKENGEVKISKELNSKNDFLNDIQTDIFGFDVNREKIDNPNFKKQANAKSALLNLINTIDKEQ